MKNKKVAIVQSNYIPWKGYFDLIAAVDIFILYDDVQYTHQDWRNRNRIKTPQGLKWLSVPIRKTVHYPESIYDTEISGTRWMAKHWRQLEHNYRRAPFFQEISDLIRPVYETPETRLSGLNRNLILTICQYLGITTRIIASNEFNLVRGKTRRLIDLCQQTGADQYISGPAAKNYIEEALFLEQGIALSWFDYSDYPEYPQLWQGFDHEVSILDLLFNCGRDSPQYMKHITK